MCSIETHILSYKPAIARTLCVFREFCSVATNCPIDAAWNSVRLARYVLLRRFVHHENKKLGVSAAIFRLGALFCPFGAF